MAKIRKLRGKSKKTKKSTRRSNKGKHHKGKRLTSYLENRFVYPN